MYGGNGTSLNRRRGERRKLGQASNRRKGESLAGMRAEAESGVRVGNMNPAVVVSGFSRTLWCTAFLARRQQPDFFVNGCRLSDLTCHDGSRARPVMRSPPGAAPRSWKGVAPHTLASLGTAATRDAVRRHMCCGRCACGRQTSTDRRVRTRREGAFIDSVPARSQVQRLVRHRQ